MIILDYIDKQFTLNDTKRKVLSNVFWAILSKCVNLLGVFIVGIIIARYLGPEQYGLMNYVISFVAIFQVLADFGIDNIQIREEAKHPERRNELIGTAFILKIIFAIVTILLLTIITYIFGTAPTTRCYILIYSLRVILNTFGVFRNHFTSIVWNEYIAKTEIFRTIIGTVVKMFMLYLNASLVWFIASLVLDSLLLSSGYLYSYNIKINKASQCKFNKHIANKLVKQSFPLFLSSVAIVIYCRIDQLMIGELLDNTKLGVYSVAIQFTNVLIFVPTIIAQTISPILVQAKVTDTTRYKALAYQFISITVWGCIIIAIIVSTLAYPLVNYTFGEAYICASPILSMMAFKVVGDALSQTSGQIMIVDGMQKYASIRNLIGCVVCVVLNLILIKKYGIVGTAITALITIFSSGFFANLVIRPYRYIFRLQVKSLFYGWKTVWYLYSTSKIITKNDN